MRDKKYIIALVILSVCVKLLFLFFTHAHQHVQVYEYEQVACNLLSEKGFYYENHGASKYYAGIAPGFPVLCYLVYKIFGHHYFPVIFIQIIISSAIVIPIFLISRKIFDAKAASIAGILAALFPPFIIYSTSKLHTMTIYSFLFALFVWLFLALKDAATAKRAALTGMIAGLAILFRITSTALLFIAIMWFYFISREDIKKKMSAIFIIVSISFLMLLPWGIRNYIIFGKPLLLQTNKGESFWFGNMPGSTGSLYTKGGKTISETAQAELPANFYSMNEIEQGDYLYKITMGYFKKDPASFIGRIIKKVFYFWYFSPYQGALYPRQWMKAYKIYYIVIFSLALFSLIYNFFIKKKDWRDASLIVLILAALTAAHSLYFVEARHRWSVEPLLLIFTANAIILLSGFLYRHIILRYRQ